MWTNLITTHTVGPVETCIIRRLGNHPKVSIIYLEIYDIFIIRTLGLISEGGVLSEELYN